MPPPTIAPPIHLRGQKGASIATQNAAPVSRMAATSEIRVSATL
jgi:hypothetical protein